VYDLRRTKTYLVLCLISGCLAGCWDKTELDELAITSASALDLDKDRWVLSYQVIIPSAISAASGGLKGTSASQMPVVVHSTNGLTINDAVSQSYMEAPRKLYFGHNSVLIIGEKAAESGLEQITDLYFRNPNVRDTVSLIIASGDGRSILEQLVSMEAIPGQAIRGILEKEDEYLSAIPNVKIYEYAKQMLSPSNSALLPEILISGKDEVTRVDQLSKTTMPSKLKLGRAAIIKNEKLIGWMNSEEALGVAFLRNKIHSSIIPFSCEEKSSSQKDSTFLLTSSKTQIAISAKDDGYDLSAEIKVKGRLNETGCSLDLIKPENIRIMEESIASEIEKLIHKAWAAIQKYDADVAGFSELISRKYPRHWENQSKVPSVIKKINLNTKTEVRVAKVGLSNKGYMKLKELK
jgi:spore germination protein KC